MAKRSLAVLALFLLWPGLTFAQVRSPQPVEVSIRGKLFANSGQLPDRIEVRLERAELQLVASTYTDSIGNFEFRNLSAGAYNVVVRLDGYEEARQYVDMATSTRNGATVTLTLNRKTTISRPSSGDSDTVDVVDLQRNYPKKAVQEYEKASEESRKGNPLKAAQLLEDVVKLAPDFYQAHNNLGVFYQKLNRYRDAEREYHVARELNPRASEPLVNLGSLLIQESDSRRNEGPAVVGRVLDDALDVLDEAVKLDPRSSIAYYYLGSAYYKSDFLDAAEKNLLRAHQLDDKSRPVRLMLVNVYMKEGKWEELLAQLNAYIAENPKAEDLKQMEDMRSKVLEGLQTFRK